MKVIDQKIVGVSVIKDSIQDTPKSNIIHMHEAVERGEILEGRTYQIRPAGSAAFYVTINDIVLNQGTQQEMRRPFEIFVNSKDVSSQQWVVALTRMISAVFRKGGDVTFMVEELCSVYDAQGGYFIGGGERVNSTPAHIGKVIQQHLTYLGLLNPAVDVPKEEIKGSLSVCSKCHERSMMMQSGCGTCTSCGYSVCG